MQIAMIGLGRMGANMVRRLIRKGHSCVVFNRSPQAVNELVKEKAIGPRRSQTSRRNWTNPGRSG
jgi:6-phosphogluconate dehydrogenase